MLDEISFWSIPIVNLHIGLPFMQRANPANPALAIQDIITIPVLIFVGLCGFAHTTMDFQSNLPVRNDRTSRSMAVFSASVDDITGTSMLSSPQALPDIMQ